MAKTLGDVMPALQQGAIDGAIAGTPVFTAFHYQDAAKYITAALLPVDGGGIVGSMGAGHQLARNEKR